DLSTADPSPADDEIVRLNLRLRAERSQSFHDAAETVGLLDAELARPGEAGRGVRRRREHRERGDLVGEEREAHLTRRHSAEIARARREEELSYRFSDLRRDDTFVDLASRLAEDVEEGGSRRVQTDAADRQSTARDRRRHEEEGGRRR